MGLDEALDPGGAAALAARHARVELGEAGEYLHELAPG